MVALGDLPQVAASASSRHPTVLSSQISGSTGNTAIRRRAPIWPAVGLVPPSRNDTVSSRSRTGPDGFECGQRLAVVAEGDSDVARRADCFRDATAVTVKEPRDVDMTAHRVSLRHGTQTGKAELRNEGSVSREWSVRVRPWSEAVVATTTGLRQEGRT